MSIVERARADICALRPYVSARQDPARGILLNANESPWQPPGLNQDLNRYPEPQPAGLLKTLARLYQCDTRQLFVGRGSDEAIDLLCRAFCAAGKDAIVTAPPTFGMYAVAAGIQGARVIEVSLKGPDFALDSEAVGAAIGADDGVKLVFLCSPNNPSGGLADSQSVERVLEAASGQALVIVDEAYAEFSDQPSWIGRLSDFDNLAVLRTLSKAYGLAGLRCGALVARSEVIDLIRRIMPPYPVPATTVQTALEVLNGPAASELASRVRQIVATREWLRDRLSKLAIVKRVYPSAANFLLVAFYDAAHVDAALRESGMIVRQFSNLLPDHLRITIGERQDMMALANVLDTLA